MRIQFKYRFESAHRFTKASSGKCQTPHGHTWWISVAVETNDKKLNEYEMVTEFSLVKSKWKLFIEETVDHSFLYHHEDPLLESFEQHIPNFRGLPFPGDPTTELICGLMFTKAQTLIEELNHRLGTRLFVVEVLIDETPTNSVSLNHDSPLLLDIQHRIAAPYVGWWSTSDITSRRIEHLKSKMLLND